MRLAAITAMLNSLEFTKANFEREHERNHIMQVICQNALKAEKATHTEATIRTRAMECLVKIVSLYYQVQNLEKFVRNVLTKNSYFYVLFQFMPPYMSEIFTLTMKAMEDDEQICLQVFLFEEKLFGVL